MKFRTLDEADAAGKRVLVRVDFNVPMEDGRITDDTRLKAALPTIRDLRRMSARVILLSHFDRPKGKRTPSMSLQPTAGPLSELLGARVAFADDCIGEAALEAVSRLGNGEVLLLENLRFHAGEEKNDPEFARELAVLGDLYVNDAFSVSHRAHASTEALARLLPAYAGPSMLAEISALKLAVDAPQRPVAAIVGGSKVSTKIDVLGHLAQKVDYLIIGGGMANTFLFAKGYAVGKSLHEAGAVSTVEDIQRKAADAGCKIVLPVDAVVASELKANVETAIVPVNQAPADKMILDVGPASVKEFAQTIANCKTLLWNGPVGAFETPPFGEATFELAREAAKLTKAGALTTIAGGGDTVAALNAAHVTDQFTYVSTAGGAFLEWLEGRTLPGVAVLMRS